MGSSTGIAWTDATWNPVRGCSRVSEGCRNCYAEVIASRFSGPGQPFAGIAGSPRRYSSRDGHMKATGQRFGWTGRVELVPEKLSEPLRWRKPRRVFVNSMSDLFHEKLGDEDIAAVFGVMAACPHITFQVLTKRPERMRAWFRWAAAPASEGPDLYCQREAFRALGEEKDEFPMHAVKGTFRAFSWPLPNLWLGVSVEDQKTADARIPLLLETPAAVRFVSYEPALGLVDFRRYVGGPDKDGDCALCGLAWGEGMDNGCPPGFTRLDWIIVGGESGPKARPFDIVWAFSVVEQCKAAGVPVFVKQLGGYAILDRRFIRPGATRRLDDRAGADPEEWPIDLRVQEFPEVARG